MNIKILVTYIIFLAFSSTQAFSITIDPFNTDQSTDSTKTINTIAPAQALGGARKILSKKTSGSLGRVSSTSFYDPAPEILNGAFFHSQDAGITGESQLTWDGTTSSSFNAFGLGEIDFTKDGSTAFVLSILDFNAPSSGDVKITLSVFNGPETASLTIPVSAPGELTLPFSAFIKSDSTPFDFTKVGALSMKIAGGSAADLTLDFLKTNGKCELIPINGGQVIVDLCGACGGDNSSCKDCSGVPNGEAKPDQCGVCNGDGQSCLDCEVEDNGDLSTALDQAAKVQEHNIKVVANIMLRQYGSKVKGLKKKIEQYKLEAHRLQIRNWTLSWVIPPKTISCANQTLCIQNEVNVTVIDEYRKHAQELYNINKKITDLYLKYSKKKVNVQKYSSQAKTSYDAAIELAAQVPKGQDICS